MSDGGWWRTGRRQNSVETTASGAAGLTWLTEFIVWRDLVRHGTGPAADESRATNGSDEFQSPSLVNVMKLDRGWFSAHLHQKEQLFIDR